MASELEILASLRRHEVPFVVIGGYAVNFHGYVRTTEDADVVWLRSPQTEQSLLLALTELECNTSDRRSTRTLVLNELIR